MKTTLLQLTPRKRKRAWFAVLSIALFILLSQVAQAQPPSHDPSTMIRNLEQRHRFDTAQSFDGNTAEFKPLGFNSRGGGRPCSDKKRKFLLPLFSKRAVLQRGEYRLLHAGRPIDQRYRALH